MQMAIQTPSPGVMQTFVDEEIASLLHELHPAATQWPDIRPDRKLDKDLGLDSLSRMELLARLEDRFQVAIPTQAGTEASTPGELLKVLLRSEPRLVRRDVAAPATTSPIAPLDVPAEAVTLPDVLAWHAQKHGVRAHVHFVEGEADGCVLTYAALWEKAGRIAGGLQERGVRPGETVALMFPTHPDLLASFFGVMRAGAVPVPLYPPSRPSEFSEYWRRQAGILQNCQARIMLIGPSLSAHRQLVGVMAGTVEHVLTADELQGNAPPVQPVPAASDDLAMLQYTSGSTADPKGVMLTHANLLSNLRAMGQAIRVSAGDVFVSWLPLYHDMGLIGAWLGCLYFGIPLVLMSPQAFLIRPERWLWAIHRYQGTLSAAPNFAYELCLHRIEDADVNKLDLSRLRLAFCGAEPVSPVTMQQFTERFAKYGLRTQALFPVYGLAENALALTFPPLDRGLKMLAIERERFLRNGEAVPSRHATTPSLTFVSCGAPLPGNELRVVDEASSELPDGRQGRIEFRGPSATTGYYRKEELSHAFMHDGWRDTGDLGFVHQGELYLTGRSKDVIIRAGRHLHPHHIEQEVGDVPGVRKGRVAAFGAHAEGTERLVVVAETRVLDAAGRKALRAAIDAAVQKMAGEPADEIVLAAPGTVLKTSSGKLRRAACKEAYEAGQLGSPDRVHLAAVVWRSLWSRMRRHGVRYRELTYAAYAWTVLAAMSLLAAPAILVLPTLDQRWWLVRKLLGATALLTHVRLERQWVAALPSEPCIFVANHASNLDALVAIWALPRPVSIVAKRELATWPLHAFLKRLGVVFVDRNDFQRATSIVKTVQEQRRDLLFFPEGTFRRMPGLLPFKLGAFLTATQAGMPIVPLVLKGTRAVLRGDDRLPRAGVIGVTIETPVRPRSHAPAWQEALRLSDAARTLYLHASGEPDLGEAEFGALSER
jgi:1-acyl-sn-glycerol-3-phosphate acyltransferase